MPAGVAHVGQVTGVGPARDGLQLTRSSRDTSAAPIRSPVAATDPDGAWGAGMASPLGTCGRWRAATNRLSMELRLTPSARATAARDQPTSITATI